MILLSLRVMVVDGIPPRSVWYQNNAGPERVGGIRPSYIFFSFFLSRLQRSFMNNTIVKQSVYLISSMNESSMLVLQ